MEVRCPNCNKSYIMPREKIGEQGVRVRCPACGHVFKLMPESSFITTPRPSISSPDHLSDSIPAKIADKEETPPPPPQESDIPTSPSASKPVRLAIPLKYALIPSLIPIIVFSVYILLIHFTNLLPFENGFFTPVGKKVPLDKKTKKIVKKIVLMTMTGEKNYLSRAMELVDTALQASPGHPDLLGIKAEIAAETKGSKSESTAVSYALRALTREHDNPYALRALSIFFLQSDKPTSSYYLEKLLSSLRRSPPGIIDAKTRWLMAAHYIKDQDFKKAIINLEKAIEKNPYLIICYKDLAKIWHIQGSIKNEKDYLTLYSEMKTKLINKIENMQ